MRGSRYGLVVGSMTHDAWKTGVNYRGSDGKLNTFTVYGGASSKVTRDTMPHGSVSEPPLLRHLFVGYYDDWRTGTEEFAAMHANPRGFRAGRH